MKNLNLFFLGTLLIGASALAFYQNPMASNYQGQVNVGAYMQGQAAGQAAYMPAYRAVPTVGENFATDPCPAGRYDTTGLQTVNGQAMPVPAGRSH